jgi:hypothetical protein
MSGPGDDYTPEEVDELYEALSEALEEYAASGGAGGIGGELIAGITVTAKVEWAGEYAHNGRGGQRTVRLNPTNLTAVRDAVRKAQRMEAADALTVTLLREYGSNVRFRHIEQFRLRLQ